MAHIVDGEKKAYLDYGKAFDEQREMEANALNAIYAEARYIEEHDFTNLAKQAGRTLTEAEFERRLKKISPPNLILVTRNPTDGECDWCLVPRGSQFKVLILTKPDGSLVGIDSYQRMPILNEFDTVKMKERIIQRVATNDRENMITELPKYDIEYDEDGHKRFKWRGLNNLQQKVLEPCGLQKGWRSVLARAVIKGALELERVEREFDPVDNAAWQAKMKGKDTGFGL